MINSAPRDYSFIAPVYDRLFNVPLAEGHREIGKLVVAETKSRKMKVLEVGVGSGLTMNYLPQKVDFTGIDVSTQMLRIAERKAVAMNRRNISLRKMDAHKLGFKANTFDLVLAPSVLTALSSPEQGMKEMVRVTKKGGHIAVIANLRVKDSLRSDLVRLMDPLTRRCLGYRTDMNVETFADFKGLKLIKKKRVNNLLGLHLSWFLLFQKT